MELTVEDLVYYASLTDDQCEKIRRDRHENYDFLIFIEKQIEDQIIDPQLKLEEQDELKMIRNAIPSPNDACQELKTLNGEDCEECMGI